MGRTEGESLLFAHRAELGNYALNELVQKSATTFAGRSTYVCPSVFINDDADGFFCHGPICLIGARRVVPASRAI